MIDNFSGIILGSDSFSIYNEKGIRNPFFLLNFSSLFTQEKKIYIYIPLKHTLPKGFKGDFKEIIHY